MPKKLIFGESHDDSAPMEVIIELLPWLKEQGYSVFLDEQVETPDLDDFGKVIDRGKDDAPYYGSTEVGMRLGVNQHLLTWEKLTRELKKNSISHKGIDSKEGRDLMKKDHDKGMLLRDAVMSRAYLEEKKPLITCVGIGHFAGLHANFKEKKKENDFLFIHIYKKENYLSPAAKIGNALVFHYKPHKKENIVKKIKTAILMEPLKEEESHFSFNLLTKKDSFIPEDINNEEIHPSPINHSKKKS